MQLVRKTAALYQAIAAFFFWAMTPLMAHAQGLSKVKTVLTSVEGAMDAVKVITVTIAVLWVGYKVLFQGQTLRECAPILLGGALIAAAAEIASMLVG